MTRAEARDEMCKRVKDALEAYATTKGLSITIVYDDVEGVPPGGKGCFFRVVPRHGDAGSHSLGAVGNRRFEATGVLFVQMFIPFGQGNKLADELDKALKDAVMSYDKGILFSRPSSKEVGKSGPWSQVNFSVWFAYDERI